MSDQRGGRIDGDAIAAEVRRALMKAGADPTDPAVRAAVVSALDRTPGRKLTAAQKATLALELKTHGASYREIAHAVGYSGPGAAYKAVMRGLETMQREPAEALRTLAVDRLEGILGGGLYRKAKSGDLKAVDRVLKVMRETRRYVPGLEVPANAELTGAGGGAIVVELNVPEPVPTVPVPQAELGGVVIDLGPDAVHEVDDA